MSLTKALRVREDGYVYWGASRKKGVTYESWLSPETYQRTRLSTAMGNAKKRAKALSLPFDLTVDYLASIFPSDQLCPALGIPLEWGEANRKSSPSLDRIKPSEGYVRGNVCWLSQLANQIKSNATTAEICAVAEFLRKSTTDDNHPTGRC